MNVTPAKVEIIYRHFILWKLRFSLMRKAFSGRGTGPWRAIFSMSEKDKPPTEVRLDLMTANRVQVG
jgi:hypothetical protein